MTTHDHQTTQRRAAKARASRPATAGLRFRVARLATCCLAAAVIWACGPVYIPVPPPSAATQTAFTAQLVTTATTDAPGAERRLWTAMGAPHTPARNATYYLFDQERNGGVIATATDDGSYLAPPLEGTEGDHIFVRYRDQNGDDSEVACVILSEARDFAALCPP